MGRPKKVLDNVQDFAARRASGSASRGFGQSRKARLATDRARGARARMASDPWSERWA